MSCRIIVLRPFQPHLILDVILSILIFKKLEHQEGTPWFQFHEVFLFLFWIFVHVASDFVEVELVIDLVHFLLGLGLRHHLQVLIGHLTLCEQPLSLDLFNRLHNEQVFLLVSMAADEHHENVRELLALICRQLVEGRTPDDIFEEIRGYGIN